MDDMENQSRRLAITLRRLHDIVTAHEVIPGFIAPSLAACMRQSIDKVFADLDLPTGGLKENTTVRTAGWGDRGGTKQPMA